MFDQFSSDAPKAFLGRFNTDGLEDFTQDDEGLQPLCGIWILTERGTARPVSCWCDGADSKVRDLLGIPIARSSHIDWSLNIYLRIPEFLAQHKTASFSIIFCWPRRQLSFLTALTGKSCPLQLVGVEEVR